MREDINELMGRWHEFSEQRADAIARQFSAEMVTLIDDVHRVAIGSKVALTFQTADEFAKYVLDLRQNETNWSRALGETILHAHRELDLKNGDAAARVFSEFESTCPWRIFVDIAKIGRQNTIGS